MTELVSGNCFLRLSREDAEFGVKLGGTVKDSVFYYNDGLADGTAEAGRRHVSRRDAGATRADRSAPPYTSYGKTPSSV